MPNTVEYADNDFDGSNYTESGIVTYTCQHNTSITQEISCDESGMWETATLECPSCE